MHCVHALGLGPLDRRAVARSEIRDQSDNLLRARDSASVVRHVDVESGVHCLIRVIRRRVPYHRDVVAQLGGKANGRFDAGMRYQADHDEPVDAVVLELQIQIRVGEAAGAPMLLDDNVTWLGRELETELATPGAILEALSCQRRFLNGRNVLPRLVVARTVAMMHGIENRQLRLAGGVEDLQHMSNAVIRFGDSPNAGPDLAALGNEVVVRIDHKKRRELLFMRCCCHDFLNDRPATKVDGCMWIDYSRTEYLAPSRLAIVRGIVRADARQTGASPL
jgi:hypothetical protein